MKDYLIVGFGLAGLNIAQELTQQDKTFTIIDNHTQNASSIAGGVINPLILKRFTKSWKVDEFLPYAVDRYQTLQNQVGEKLFYKLPIYRKIKSTREQNDWFIAADKPGLSAYMATPLKQLKNLPSPYRYGEVEQTWWLNTKKLIHVYSSYLLQQNVFRKETFQYDDVILQSDFIQYQNITARKIIFCEGIQVLQNPYFLNLPLIGNKGEYLLLQIPQLKIKKVIKTAIALIPLGQGYYKFGATYSRDYTDLSPEKSARDFLIKKLEEIIDGPYTIVGQTTGIRPTVLDRRPLIGAHPKHPQLLILNGLGSHGILMAPLAAHWLYEYDQLQKPLPKVADVRRYPKS